MEVFDFVWECEGFAVLGDDDGVGAQDCGGAEVAESAEIFIGGGVGRIEKDVVKSWLSSVAGQESLQSAEDLGGKNRCAGADGERFEIFADQCDGRCMIFDEDDSCGAAAESFDADGAGAGKEVDEIRAGDFWTENVEQGFAELVAGGAEGKALEGFKQAGAVLAGDYAHGWT